MSNNQEYNRGAAAMIAQQQEVNEKPAVTSSSSDDGNNSSGDSDAMENKSTTHQGTPEVAYKDYSDVAPESRKNEATLIVQGGQTKDPTFPVKLHMILSNPEFSEVISWLPHGRSWRILQQKAFEERVIPHYFRHGRYSSFARQVNGWGFRRIVHGSDYNSYFHEMFLRGMPHLCDRMRRLTTKDVSERKGKDEPIPDFYALSRDHPLPEHSNVTEQVSVATTSTGTSEALAALEFAVLNKRRSDLLDKITQATQSQGNVGNGMQQAPVDQQNLQLLQQLVAGQSNAQIAQVAPAPAPTPGAGSMNHVLGLFAAIGGNPQPQQQQEEQAASNNSTTNLLLQLGVKALLQQAQAPPPPPPPPQPLSMAQILQALMQNQSQAATTQAAPVQPQPSPPASIGSSTTPSVVSSQQTPSSRTSTVAGTTELGADGSADLLRMLGEAANPTVQQQLSQFFQTQNQQ